MTENIKNNLYTYSLEDAKHSRIQDEKYNVPRVTLTGKLVNNFQMYETTPNSAGKVYVNIFSAVQQISKRNNEISSTFINFNQFVEKGSPLHYQYMEFKEKFHDIKEKNPWMPVTIKGVVENVQQKISIFNPETNLKEKTDEIIISKQIRALNKEINIEDKNHNHSATIQVQGQLTKKPTLHPIEAHDIYNNVSSRDVLIVNLETKNTYNNKTSTIETTVWIQNKDDIKNIVDLDLKQGDKMFVSSSFFQKEKSVYSNTIRDYQLSTNKDSIIEIQKKNELPIIVRGVPHKQSLLKNKQKNPKADSSIAIEALEEAPSIGKSVI